MFRVAGTIEVPQERLVIVRHSPVLEPMPVTVAVDDHVARAQVVGDRIAHAPAVDSADVADAAVGWLVRVACKNNVRISPGEATAVPTSRWPVPFDAPWSSPDRPRRSSCDPVAMSPAS